MFLLYLSIYLSVYLRLPPWGRNMRNSPGSRRSMTGTDGRRTRFFLLIPSFDVQNVYFCRLYHRIAPLVPYRKSEILRKSHIFDEILDSVHSLFSYYCTACASRLFSRLTNPTLKRAPCAIKSTKYFENNADTLISWQVRPLRHLASNDCVWHGH